MSGVEEGRCDAADAKVIGRKWRQPNIFNAQDGGPPVLARDDGLAIAGRG